MHYFLSSHANFNQASLRFPPCSLLAEQHETWRRITRCHRCFMFRAEHQNAASRFFTRYDAGLVQAHPAQVAGHPGRLPARHRAVGDVGRAREKTALSSLLDEPIVEFARREGRLQEARAILLTQQPSQGSFSRRTTFERGRPRWMQAGAIWKSRNRNAFGSSVQGDCRASCADRVHGGTSNARFP